MIRKKSIIYDIDWFTIALFAGLIIFGWLNIYASIYDEEAKTSILNMSLSSGKQLIWIFTAVAIILIIMAVDLNFYETFAYGIYGTVIVALIAVLLFGKEIAGSRSWFELGRFSIQPSEFAKFACSLAIAKYLGDTGAKLNNLKDRLILGGMIGLPALLIILQGDTGTALVFSAFIIVLYREGLSPFIIATGLSLAALFVLTLLIPQIHLLIGVGVIGLILIIKERRKIKNIKKISIFLTLVVAVIISVDFFVSDILQPHQQNRIKVLVNPDIDPLGYGWNVTQSKIAIGSGGFLGKGFLKGTQTKFDFVPEQSTDFIFCTIGEEHGWLGSFIVIALFITLIIRIIYISERQKYRFARVYGYSVACILFFHFTVNIGMTIGLFPVIGIPLPFFSYGGSSLWSFTILLFILVKQDAHRKQILFR